MENPNNVPTQKHKTASIVIGAVVVFVIALVALLSGKKPAAPAPAATDLGMETGDTSASNPTTVTSGTTTTSHAAAAVYKDGTYSATGSYFSPGGPDQIGVTLTLSKDIVTGVSVTPEPGDPMSANYQNQFISGYKAYVVGQNIADIHLTKVSGSSLTPIGFDDALAKIKAEAKV